MSGLGCPAARLERQPRWRKRKHDVVSTPLVVIATPGQDGLEARAIASVTEVSSRSPTANEVDMMGRLHTRQFSPATSYEQCDPPVRLSLKIVSALAEVFVLPPQLNEACKDALLQKASTIAGATVGDEMRNAFPHRVPPLQLRRYDGLSSKMTTAVRAKATVALPFWPQDLSTFKATAPEHVAFIPKMPSSSMDPERPGGESSESEDDECLQDSRCKPKPEILMAFLRLDRLLVPGCDFEDVLRLAGACLGLDADVVQEKLDSVNILGYRRNFQRYKTDLDMSMMLWERHLWTRGYHPSSCLLADASKVGKANIFCQRMDEFQRAPGLHDFDYAAIDKQLMFRRFLGPIGCLAYVEADLSHK